MVRRFEPRPKIEEAAPRVEAEEKKAGEKKQPLGPREALLKEATVRFEDFQRRFGKTINAYFGSPDIQFTMEPGGWYIDLENLRVNADPSFFLNRGYSESEALFAIFHEAEHFRDMLQNPTAYETHFARVKRETEVHGGYPKALFRFYNCLDDVSVNKVVMNRWEAGEKAKDALYPKLFPTKDFRTAGKPPQPVPRHRQLMYALLRETMLPEEPANVDPEVREAIEKWQKKGGVRKAIDALTAVDPRGHAALDPAERLDRVRISLEPVFEEFYKRDLKDRKPEEKPGKGAGEGGGDPFGDDPFKGALPDPIDPEDLLKAARKIRRAIDKKKKDKFKERMGVEQKDFIAYQKDYRLVEKHIEKLSRTFEEVIEKRKSYRRVLRKPVKEGPILDARRAATAVAEIQAGHFEPIVMLDFEKKEVLRQLPNQLEFTLVADGSGSMVGGAKEVMQRRMAVLAMEAFANFRERIEKERRRGEPIQLEISSEIRMFSDADEVIKPLTKSLNHEDRVKMHKRLRALPAGGNNEPDTFQAIQREQFNNERCKRMQEGELKKIILFLTDGGTSKEAVQAEMRRLYDLAGKTKDGRSNLVIAGLGFDEGREAVEIYAPNGYYAESFEQVPEIFRKFIAKIMEEV